MSVMLPPSSVADLVLRLYMTSQARSCGQSHRGPRAGEVSVAHVRKQYAEPGRLERNGIGGPRIVPRHGLGENRDLLRRRAVGSKIGRHTDGRGQFMDRHGDVVQGGTGSTEYGC